MNKVVRSVMLSTPPPYKFARPEPINAVAPRSVAAALVIFSIMDALGDACRVDQTIVLRVERIGSEAENEVFLLGIAADHRLANR